MKKIDVDGKEKLMLLDSSLYAPKGFAGLDKLRSLISLQGKLEKDLPEEAVLADATKRREMTDEEEKVKYTVLLNLNEYKILKELVNGLEWRPHAAKLGLKLCELVENATDAKEEDT